ncbi:major facilitator superfamily domain-containing protein [Halenospora varia]|nr:major facilitator superfamily domain-containing protein [Halenospora varia]
MEDSKQENGKTEAVIDEKQSIPSTPALDALHHPAKEPPPIYSAFSPGRKRFILIVMTIAGFFGPFAGNIYLPALPALPVLQKEFHVSATAINASITVFMAVFAVRPLLWSSYSDWKGRRPLYIISVAIYIVANILLAAVPSNYVALMVLRVVQAFGSAAVVSMGAGTVADVGEQVPEEQRGPAPPKPSLIGFWRLFRYPPIGITYHWSIIAVGFGYLAVGIAMIIGSLCVGHFSDWRRARAVKVSPNGEVDPENRLVEQIWGVLLCASGWLMFGWFINYKIHSAAVLISTFLTGFGMTWVFVATTAFLTECVKQQAAGAFALGNLLRNPGAVVAAVVTQPLQIMDLVLVDNAVIILRKKYPGWREERNAKMAAMIKAKKTP